MNGLIFYFILFFFGVAMGYAFGKTNKGKMVDYTNNLPNGFMRVVSTDRVSTVLESIDVKRKRFLVETKVFGEKPIRPGDVVRKIKRDKERRDLDIPVLGFPPLVKDELFSLA